MSNSDQETTLTLREETVERFERLRSEFNEPDVPEMSDDAWLNSLMDTLEAAEDGYYSEATNQ